MYVSMARITSVIPFYRFASSYTRTCIKVPENTDIHKKEGHGEQARHKHSNHINWRWFYASMLCSLSYERRDVVRGYIHVLDDSIHEKSFSHFPYNSSYSSRALRKSETKWRFSKSLVDLREQLGANLYAQISDENSDYPDSKVLCYRLLEGYDFGKFRVSNVDRFEQSKERVQTKRGHQSRSQRSLYILTSRINAYDWLNSESFLFHGIPATPYPYLSSVNLIFSVDSNSFRIPMLCLSPSFPA